jgi:hypothetical protein
MPDFPLTLTAEERQYLVDLLKAEFKDVRLEEHRTRTPLYRETVVHQESIIAALMNKLEQPPVV